MKQLKYESKKRWIGFTFAIPWLIGFIFFFLIPMVNSVRFGFSDIKANMNGISYEFVGLKNFKYLSTQDSTFLVNTFKTALQTFSDLFLTLFFSMFVAIVLTQKFRGRLVARALFFLPVIVASGVVMGYINGDSVSQEMLQGDSVSIQFDVLYGMLRSTGIGESTIQSIVGFMDSIFSVVWKAGIQTLIFMSGLQAIPISVKEAASVEGATAWEFFWKITFPMMLPMIQLNVIYTVVNSFTDSSNAIISRIFSLNKSLDYSYSSAVAWTYFLFVFIMVILVYAVINRVSAKYER